MPFTFSNTSNPTIFWPHQEQFLCLCDVLAYKNASHVLLSFPYQLSLDPIILPLQITFAPVSFSQNHLSNLFYWLTPAEQLSSIREIY